MRGFFSFYFAWEEVAKRLRQQIPPLRCGLTTKTRLGALRVADDGKDGCYGEHHVDGGSRWLRPANGFAVEETAVTSSGVCSCDGEHQGGECVVAEGFAKVAAEQRGEGAGGAAAGA